jgi:hypothetical protein
MTTPLSYAKWQQTLSPVRLAQMADLQVAYAAYLRRTSRNRRRPALALLVALVVVEKWPR